MKKTFTLLCCVAAAAMFQAGQAATATNYKSVVIEHSDNGISKISIENGMTTAMTDGDLVLSYEKGGVKYEIRHSLADVRHWTFSTEAGDSNLWAGIDGVVNENTVGIDWQGDVINLTNLPVNSQITLVGIDGRTVSSVKATGEYSVKLGELTGGVYVLTINGKSLKIAVK